MAVIPLSGITAEKKYNEELNIIQANLLLRGEDKKLIALAPVSAEEGAFELAACLAEINALGDRRVLLADLSGKSKNVLDANVLTGQKGLFDFLRGIAGVKECIQQTDIENLHFLSAGDRDEHVQELLNGKRMEELTELLREQYDFVFILLPSADSSKDGILITRLLDGIVLIVRSGAPAGKAHRSVEALKQAAPLIGIILIKERFSLIPEFLKKGKKKNKK